jgi:hypothetical protein
MRFIGHGHPGAWKMAIYDELTHRWSASTTESWFSSNEPSDRIAHGYHQNTINQANGDQYFRIFSDRCFRRSGSTGLWTQLPSPALSFTAYGAGCEWFANANALVYAGRNSVAWFNGTNWEILYNGNLSTLSQYQSICLYSAQNQCVYFGGGAGDSNRRTLHRIMRDKAVSRLADCPVSYGTASSPTAVDPVSGRLLVFGQGDNGSSCAQGGYYFNDGTNTWSSFSASNAPTVSEDRLLVAIPTHGVIMMVDQPKTTPRVFLYKHSLSGGVAIDTTPPPPPTGLTIS